MTTNATDGAAMLAAEEKLATDLQKIFEQFAGALLPSTPVETIWSDDIAEDGKTRVLMLDLIDGRCYMLSVCPGQPIRGGMV